MPVYMDIHELPPGTTADDVAKAHAHDVALQSKYGVNYSKYWLNEDSRKIFCLCHAPDAESAVRVHREAHGLVAEKLIQVEPDLAEAFLGAASINQAGAALLPGSTDERDPAIRSILFTDIVGSTSLTQRLGDEAAMELLHVHDDIVRTSLADLGGREVKHLGDGIMASFISAASAVKCATRIQREVTTHGRDNAERSIRVRIGVAAGEPVEHHDDLFGSAVQLAARLCAHAEPAQILVSNVVAELCAGKVLLFQPLGNVALKGFENPVYVHSVSWSE
jgi:class 3 adenylate cyclase